MSTTQTVGGSKVTAPKAPVATEKVDPMAGPKKLAAETAVNTYVKSGMKLGIGTGSTMKFAIDALAGKLQSGDLKNLVGVSTSERTTRQATELKVPMTSLEKAGELDLAIDGADEVATVGKEFFLIKGMGGALLREKDVASKARDFVVIVDESKLVGKLGTKSPLPVEVDKKSWNQVADKLKGMGGEPTLRGGDKPFVTDNGNYIVDVKWPNGIDNPKQLQRNLDGLEGVKAHGLFLGMADQVVVAKADGTVKTLQPGDATSVGDTFGVGQAGAVEAGQFTAATNEVLKAISTMPADMQQWAKDQLLPAATLKDATVVMQNARARIGEAFKNGGNPLAELDRTQLPKTEGEAVQFLMNRMGLTAKEQQVVKAGIDMLQSGKARLEKTNESIGGHSSLNPETFRTQMAVTDPGIDHIAMTLADPRLLNGTFVHMEIIDRPTDHTAPYSNPGSASISLMRLLMGNDAPATVFVGSPNYLPSIKQENVEGLDRASAGVKFNMPTAAHQLSNLARGLFDRGASEAKVTMDGLSKEEVVAFGKATHAQANLQEGEYISAAFNLNAILKDFGLDEGMAPISGAPTPDQRGRMLKGSLESIDIAKEGGFKKVTVDSASMTPPSYPLIEYFGVENLLDWAHHAHESGLETYGSGGMRDYHFPLLQFTGLDGVGVGFSIHETSPEKGLAGRMLPEKVLSSLEARDQAEKAPVGRASVLLRMLDEIKSDGKITPQQDALRGEIHQFLKGMARGMDGKLDTLKSTRDSAVADAGKLTDAAAKKAAEDAAKKSFEGAFKQMITDSLADPASLKQATALLEKGSKLEVNA